MIGSHDTFTYLKAKNVLVNSFSRFWKCQELSIHDQYKVGCRVFDIRVIHEESKGMNWWRIGHGAAEFDQRFPNLESICLYIKENFPGSVFRLMLEKDCDNEKVYNRFETEAMKIKKKYSKLIWDVVIKKPWKTLYRGTGLDAKCKTVDLVCRLFNWDAGKSVTDNIKNIGNLDLSISSIKKWAEKKNPKEFTQEMIDDPKTLYFMDYVGIYPKL